ncbi:hypothetical protein GCM10009584_20610 [Ornithinimicrobium humiphilum]|uniref:Helix-turn-helix protein n=1 Tax=Ornithinimicrobium humiphilum TaxID=125288 RepID=A0A543KNI6_9MICO|nr:helix-turn-helix transcriptional regulator [Ornithinimicrobium humiphilum]TQM96640.1 helix-turn-helix protein [Ornithinimicrobium humiphilum]
MTERTPSRGAPARPHTPLTRSIALQVKLVRIEPGMTQADMAAAAGLHVNTLSNIEKCHRSPTIAQVEAIAGVAGMSFSKLARRAEERLKDIGD